MALDTASITEHEISESIFLRTAEWMVYSYCLDLKCIQYGGCFQLYVDACGLIRMLHVFFVLLLFVFMLFLSQNNPNVVFSIKHCFTWPWSYVYMFVKQYMPYFLKMINDVHVHFCIYKYHRRYHCIMLKEINSYKKSLKIPRGNQKP